MEPMKGLGYDGKVLSVTRQTDPNTNQIMYIPGYNASTCIGHPNGPIKMTFQFSFGAGPVSVSAQFQLQSAVRFQFRCRSGFSFGAGPVSVSEQFHVCNYLRDRACWLRTHPKRPQQIWFIHVGAADARYPTAQHHISAFEAAQA